MPTTLSHRAYWNLFEETAEVEPPVCTDKCDVTWQYPSQLGRGLVRQIELREGVDLMISRYRLHDDMTIKLPEREHPIEYSFLLSGEVRDAVYSVHAGQYSLWGSGMAPVERTQYRATKQIEVTVHIKPERFLASWQDSFDEISPALHDLVKPTSEVYRIWTGSMTGAMQTAVQQILNCPFQGLTKRMYLESKVWELMALLIEQEVERQASRNMNHSRTHLLKPDDVDRIHHAREILLQRLDNPPSLMDLAHQVGLNDCTLKRGFRQVFGQTAFGLLHDYRLEQARQLLEERRLNVTEVARTIGFSNRSYFAAAFRKKFGVTPREYLTKLKNSA
ncbi:helix-turn-helix transcriptional regulator [Egbenema bharatensis]|uniref:helix-turn-helix transcriptional regulator n=1 Tax=Egbenema bharatensis TaxID=3463334 RepID=UPI003A8BF7EC